MIEEEEMELTTEGEGSNTESDELVPDEGATDVTNEEKLEHGKKALTELPGFHVSRADNDEHLGVFTTMEAAEHFIRGHLKPQGIEGKVEHISA